MILALLFGLMAAAGITGALLLARGLPTSAPRRILETLGAREAGPFEGVALASALESVAADRSGPPALWVVPHAQANVFVLVDGAGSPLVAVTTGALEMFDTDETHAIAGLVEARLRHADVSGATSAAGVAISAANLAGLGVLDGAEAERAAWQWPPSWVVLPLGAAFAAALERRRPCVDLDLLGARITGRPGVTARLLERMEFTAHARPLGGPVGLARLALVNPLGGEGLSRAAALCPLPMAAAERARRLRTEGDGPDGPRWARAA